MMSYGGVALHLSSVDDAEQIATKIPIADAFNFFRPRSLGDPDLDPRRHFAWFLSRPIKLNCYFNPIGASRFGYAAVLANGAMRDAILAQNFSGVALPFRMDDGLGKSFSTPLFQLPAVPLSKILTQPQLPLWLIPLVDERYRWFERAGAITVTEGTTTWANVYSQIASALGITLSVDPIAAAYLKPDASIAKSYQPLPLLLDLVASSVGQRIVRRLDGSFAAINASTGSALVIAQANSYRKFAGGSLDLGSVNA